MEYADIRYVRGNDVTLVVTVKTPVLDSEGQPVTDESGGITYETCELDTFDEWGLRIVRQGIKSNHYPAGAEAGVDRGTIVVTIPYTLPCGTYALEFTAIRNDQHVRSYELVMFGIVEDNKDANVVFGEIGGHRSLDLDLTVQYISQTTTRGKNAYELWREMEGNEDKTLQDYIDEVLDLTTITENARHPDYVGEDNYVYRWDTDTQSYYNTDIYVKGERGLKGDKGDKGDTGATGATGAQGIQGEQGEKGDPFTYSDFTAEQLAALRGPQGDKGDKGDPMRYEDLSPAQIESLKGPKGDDGADGQDGQDGQDGVSPHIDSTSGNWYVGSTDTGVHAQGPKGDKGDKGDPGTGSEVTEQTVAGWGFTKNTGDYSKPSTGIPSTDLSSAVQTSLGKADNAVPATRKVNGKALSSDVTLNAEDVGALPDDTQLFSGDYDDLSNKPTIPDISGKEDKVDIVSASGATLTAEVGKYYTLSNVGTLAITLPTIAAGTTKVQTVTFYVPAGSSPAVTFTSTHTIIYPKDYKIEANGLYEISAAWNGIGWIIGQLTLEIPT